MSGDHPTNLALMAKRFEKTVKTVEIYQKNCPNSKNLAKFHCH
jgi:hypothetical protein